MRWGPISEAPRDGTVVMFGARHWRTPTIARADDYWAGRSKDGTAGVAFWLNDATHWAPNPIQALNRSRRSKKVPPTTTERATTDTTED